MNFRLLYLVLISLITFSSFGKTISKRLISPTDSTTSIVDKTAALYMLEDGKRLYSEGKVRDAITQFRSVAMKDPHSWRPFYWIGVCHYSMSNYGLSLQYARQSLVLKNNNVDGYVHELIEKTLHLENDVYELLGKSYHQLGILDSAIINYEIAMVKISHSRVKELEIPNKIAQCRFAQSEIASGTKSERVRLVGSINTDHNEYSPILSSNGKMMYFTSRRIDTKGAKINPDDQEYFEDIYIAHWNEETNSWDSITNKVDRINSEGFDSFSFLSADGLNALMTINTSAIASKKSTNSSDIFELNFTNKGKWSTPKKIANQTVNTSFFEGCPTMTGDGNTLYFVSDRNGNKKLTDIYVSHKVGKTWGEAVPLNDTINSLGNETTPFITADGRYLFFSSDGHVGMGGLDIFVSENLGNTWSKPINLGIKFNTVNNDTHFKYYPELKKAFLSGIENVGLKSSIDMYEVDMTNFEFPVTK